ncbi:type III-A CRISPR-associated protein Csm2 [Methylococcus sp. ANG]|uniref:type III-A CRISPR-associated protein Csm2 n=1 Tax=Methylococcus sp. ANG TaxID=3231903 RepID=UPI00345A9E84
MAEYHGQQRNQGPRRGHEERFQAPALDTSTVRLAPVDAELFNGTAKNMAQAVARAGGNRNKSTQLRRFYDELVLWETRVNQASTEQRAAKFAECLPFIRMINAKAAYAEGRKLVDSSFVKLLHDTLAQVTDPATLGTCKLFWEAFMGFYKQERQD